MRAAVTSLGRQLLSRHKTWRPFVGAIVLASSLSTLSTAIEFRRLFDCQPPSPDGYCVLKEPSLSADGTCVAIMNDAATPPYWENGPQISFHPIDGGSCAAVDYVTGPSSWHRWPAWSPDGFSFAFIAGGDAATSGIWTISVGDLGNPPASLIHRVATTDARRPVWAPEGGAIAYETSIGILTLTVNLPNGVPQLVVPAGQAPSWGPDGQIAFVRSGDLWIRNNDGSERQLTHTPEDEYEPAWSPQGIWIAYRVSQNGASDLWVIAASGGTPVRLTSSPAFEEHPSWSALGDRLVYSSEENGVSSIWVATDLPDWTISVERRSWGEVKQLFR